MENLRQKADNLLRILNERSAADPENMELNMLQGYAAGIAKDAQALPADGARNCFNCDKWPVCKVAEKVGDGIKDAGFIKLQSGEHYTINAVFGIVADRCNEFVKLPTRDPGPSFTETLLEKIKNEEAPAVCVCGHAVCQHADVANGWCAVDGCNCSSFQTPPTDGK